MNKNNFIVLNKIGDGGFGVVYKVQEKLTNTIYALKILKIDENNTFKKINNEIINHKICNDHVNIIHLHNHFDDLKNSYLLLEYFGIDLFSFKFKDIKKEIKLNWFKQLTEAINYIHNMNIIHFDIKLENVLLNHETNKIKLIDFGLSVRNNDLKNIKEIKNVIVGTTDYLAPELLKKPTIITYAIDCWALGIFLYELITFKSPFKGKNSQITKSNILNYIWDNSILEEPLKSIIQNLLNVDFKTRLNTGDLLTLISDF